METEWDLLVAAEDIEKGDPIFVEDEDDNGEIMFFVKTKKNLVYLKDDEGELVAFNASSLEEVEDGYKRIIGKAENED